MTIVGWHASHEQIAPSELLRAVKRVEQAGFDAAMSSDHFSPWGERQGESGFAWSWLGAAMATTELPFGIVNAPGQRYHPAIIAQAAATLAEMFPGRFWIALGTGEASNEHITGDVWPPKDVRNRRLLECVAVIRSLLAGEEVSHDGLVRVDRARLVHPAGGAAAVDRSGGVGGHCPDRRVLGRRTHHRQPAARVTPSCAGCLRRGRWCGQAALSPGARVVGGQRRRGAWRSRTSSGGPTCSVLRSAGTWKRRATSTRCPATYGPRTCTTAC